MRKNMIDYGPVEREMERLIRFLEDPFSDEEGTVETVLTAAGISPGSKQGKRIKRSYDNCAKRGYGSVYHVDEICCDVLHKNPVELYGQLWFTPEHSVPTTKSAKTKQQNAA